MVAQFYNIDKKTPYADGWPFPEDTDYPEGEGWVKVVSKKRVKIETLARKAREIAAEIEE